MKWITTDYKGDKVEWYSADVIEDIKGRCNFVAYACHCDCCDGCGYYNGCKDIECGTYQALKILELLNKEDNE